MKNTDWSPTEIQTIARSSGKPHEVVCAAKFLAAGWNARLGSHFTDGTLNPPRELDVLVEKEEPIPAQFAAVVRVRLLVSVRGFPPERSPFSYSVSQEHLPGFAPRLLATCRALQGQSQGDQSVGPLPDVEKEGAAHLIAASGLALSRPLIAFDLLERTEKDGRKVKGGREPAAHAVYAKARDGDRQLFSAIDSSIKASIYWDQEDYQRQAPIYFAALNVPVCVLSLPFWDVSIDEGNVGQPEIRHRGYLSHLYPLRNTSQEVTALVWSIEEIADLVTIADGLFSWFRDQVTRPAFKKRWYRFDWQGAI